MRRASGAFTRRSKDGEPYLAFVPAPLPPRPAIELAEGARELVARAEDAIARLRGSRGTAVTPSGRNPAPGRNPALAHGLALLRGGVRWSVPLLCELHWLLLAQGRGADKRPGEVRRVQAWVGRTLREASYVPPPPERVVECLEALMAYLRTAEPSLVKVAVAHAQLELIHPFGDGNGRLGWLVIALLFGSEGGLADPPDLEPALRARWTDYFARLRSVRDDGDWEGWIAFFAEVVVETTDKLTGSRS